MTPALTYHGRPCNKCDGTLRYASTYRCVACYRAAAKAQPSSRKHDPRDWRAKENAERAAARLSRIEAEYRRAERMRVRSVFDLAKAMGVDNA